MITERDLREAIDECQRVRDPNANTAIKLAAFLTIQRELYGEPQYSQAPDKPIQYSGDKVGNYGDSEFLQTIKGKDPSEVWPIIDELMDTMKMINERVYNAVMRKLR